jgi:hypothetical protein
MPNSPPSISSDPLALTVVTLIEAQRADFGDRFDRQFRETELGQDEALRQYKRRLYAKLRPFPQEAILDGYESLVSARPGLIPTIPELVQAAAAEAESIARRTAVHSLPARPEPVRAEPERITAAMEQMRAAVKGRAVLAVSDPAALDGRVKAHEALLQRAAAEGAIKRPAADPMHLCAVSDCREAGSLCVDTRGGGQMFCQKHFHRG